MRRKENPFIYGGFCGRKLTLDGRPWIGDESCGWVKKCDETEGANGTFLRPSDDGLRKNKAGETEGV